VYSSMRRLRGRALDLVGQACASINRRRWAILAIVFATTQASSADFRVADFGSPCALVPERELSLGLETITPDPPRPCQRIFKGQAFDREVAITYVCEEGKFVSGAYTFHNESFDDALKSLHAVYDNLSRTYGVPYVDSSPWQQGPEPHFPQADPGKYLIAWRDERVMTSIVMVADESPGSEKWRVFVHVTPSKPQ